LVTIPIVWQEAEENIPARLQQALDL